VNGGERAPRDMERERTGRQLRGNARFEAPVNKIIETALVHVEDQAHLISLLKGRYECAHNSLFRVRV
jgi:hypothetical protein